MSTGDLNCNVGRLRSVLREMRYTYASSLPEDRLREGDPSVLLPVLHYCLLGYSSKVAAHVSSKGYELQAKTDDKLIEHHVDRDGRAEGRGGGGGDGRNVGHAAVGTRPLVSGTAFHDREHHLLQREPRGLADGLE